MSRSGRGMVEGEFHTQQHKCMYERGIKMHTRDTEARIQEIEQVAHRRHILDTEKAYFRHTQTNKYMGKDTLELGTKHTHRIHIQVRMRDT